MAGKEKGRDFRTIGPSLRSMALYVGSGKEMWP